MRNYRFFTDVCQSYVIATDQSLQTLDKIGIMGIMTPVL